jgi:hypothetical protein
VSEEREVPGSFGRGEGGAAVSLVRVRTGEHAGRGGRGCRFTKS